MSQNEIMMTVFPMFQQFIEPHLVHAHVSSLQTFQESNPVVALFYFLFYEKDELIYDVSKKTEKEIAKILTIA